MRFILHQRKVRMERTLLIHPGKLWDKEMKKWLDEGGGKEIVAFTYGDDGKVTKAIYTFKDPEGNTQGETTYAFTYSTDKIEVTRTDGDEVEKKAYTIEDGKVTKYESDWGYDALIYTEGKLTQIKDYDKENERFKKSGTSA